MKRKTYTAAALLLCVSILSSCGGKAPAAVDTTADTQSSTVQETVGQTVSETTENETSSAAGYNVLVTDENGAPVKGVTVQFCSDIECVLGTTGEDGIASFEGDEGDYTAHILSAPDGYMSDDTEYIAVPGTTEIVLKAEAGSDSSGVSEDDICDVSSFGITFTLLPKYKNTKGTIDIGANYVNKEDPVVQSFNLDYYAIHAEDVDLFNQYLEDYMNAVLDNTEKPEAPREHWDDWHNLNCNLYTIYSIDSDRTEDELREFIAKDHDSGIKLMEKLDTCGSTTFYLVQFSDADDDDERIKEYMGDLYDEFRDLLADKETFLSSVKLYEPVPEETAERAVGDVISFETTDLDGNAVSSKDIFAGHKVTMINIWATWCGPCKRELPALGTMAKEFEEKDCQIIGICTDATEEKAIARAKSIFTENDCEYIDLAPPADLETIMPCSSIPVSYFVDSEGRIIAEKVVGAHVESYPEIIDGYLASLE